MKGVDRKELAAVLTFIDWRGHLDTMSPECVDLRSTTIPDIVSPFHRARIAPVDYLFEDAEKKTRFGPPWSCDLS